MKLVVIYLLTVLLKDMGFCFANLALCVSTLILYNRNRLFCCPPRNLFIPILTECVVSITAHLSYTCR